MKYAKLHVDEYLEDTFELTLEEQGAYWRLCCLIYQNDGLLTDDDNATAYAMACHIRVWRRIKKTLITKGFIEIRNGKFWQKRCDNELRKVFIISKQAREKAAKRWNKKAKKPSEEAKEDEKPGEASRSDDAAAYANPYAPASAGADATAYAESRVESRDLSREIYNNPPRAPARGSPDAVAVQEFFASLRAENWPNSPDIPAPIFEIQRQAQAWLDRGLDASTIGEVVERVMASWAARGGSPPHSLKPMAKWLEGEVDKRRTAERREVSFMDDPAKAAAWGEVTALRDSGDHEGAKRRLAEMVDRWPEEA